MGKMKPLVSIIILNWNGWKDTIECLESLKKITYSNYEVIVLDNGSTGNDVKILKKKFGKYIRLIENKKNEGFAEGNNIAIRKILKENKSNYTLLLNNDTVVDPKFLDELIKYALKNKKSVLGSTTFYFDYLGKNDILWGQGGKILPLIATIQHKNQGKKISKKKYFFNDYVVGCSMLIPNKLLKKVGLLNKKLFLYCEDLEFCLRAKNLGFKCVTLRDSIIWHKVSASAKKDKKSIYYEIRNRFWIMKEYYPKSVYFIYLFVFMTLKLPLFLIKFMINKKFQQIKQTLLGSKDGIIHNGNLIHKF